MSKRVVVLLPTYNEKNSLSKFVQEVFEQEKKIPGWEIHLLVVDDTRSTDGTAQTIEKLSKENKRIHYYKTDPGLGVALIKGHQYSLKHLKPELLAQLDADGQVDADVLPRLVKTIEDGYDLALGSRFVTGGRNNLSFSRRMYSSGSSLVCRLLMGPLNVKEFTNSARAFTPKLFNKLNLERLPWKEQTFIVQPAFLNEAIRAGAKYKEVPLVFKNRAEGYSKNKVLNYTIDVISYSLDARLHKWGINLPLFKLTSKIKSKI